jgi:hypothetical protein
MTVSASEIVGIGTVSVPVGAGIPANSGAPMFNEFRNRLLEVRLEPTCVPERKQYDNMIWIESSSKADPNESWRR